MIICTLSQTQHLVEFLRYFLFFLVIISFFFKCFFITSLKYLLSKKLYQRLDNVYEFDKKENDQRINKKPIVKKYNKLDLIYSSKFIFQKYPDNINFSSLSFVSKYSYLLGFKYYIILIS